MKDEDKNLSMMQSEAVHYILRPESDGAALLAFDMGLGKTRTGLMVAREGGFDVTLVVAPLQTLDGWAETADREVPNLPVFRIANNKAGRAALANFQWRAPGVYLIGPEYWERLAWVQSPVKKRRKTDPDRTRKTNSGVWGGDGYLLIFDESHRTANAGSWTNRALMNLDPGVFKLSMSGTFMGDKFEGAFGATRWLWPHRTDIIPPNIFDWAGQWAETKYDRFKPRNMAVVGEKNPGAFVSSLPCYIRAESLQPDPITHNVEIDLYPEQRRVYDELDDRMVAWVQDNPMVTELSITARTRKRQVTLAMPTLTFDGDELVDVSFDDDAESAKLDRLIAAIKGGDPDLGNLLVGEKLLLLTDSQKFASLVTNRLNAEFGEGTAAEWSGQVTHKRRAALKSEFIEGNLKYIVGVQAAMGTGTDGLQHASHIVVFLSRTDRNIDNAQAIARLNRQGQKHEVHAVTFIARDTIDSGQLSKQLQAALDANRIMRKKAREDERRRRRDD